MDEAYNRRNAYPPNSLPSQSGWSGHWMVGRGEQFLMWRLFRGWFIFFVSKTVTYISQSRDAFWCEFHEAIRIPRRPVLGRRRSTYMWPCLLLFVYMCVRRNWTGHRARVDSMPGYRRRRWPGIETTLLEIPRGGPCFAMDYWRWPLGGWPPSKQRRWPNVGLIVGERLRRWPNNDPILGQRLVSAGRQPLFTQ